MEAKATSSIQGDVTVKNVQDDLKGIVETGCYSIMQISGRLFELNLKFKTKRGMYFVFC